MSFIFIPMSVAKFFEAECYVNELLLILRFSAAKMLTLFPSESANSVQSLSKNQGRLSQKLEQNFLQFAWNHKRPWTTNAMLRKKSEAGGIRLPDFRVYYKVTVIKTVWSWHKNRNIVRWNRIEPRDKLMYLWSPDLWHKRQEYTMEKRQRLQ